MENNNIRTVFCQNKFDQDFYLKTFIDGKLQSVINLLGTPKLGEAWAEYQYQLTGKMDGINKLDLGAFEFRGDGWTIRFNEEKIGMDFSWKPSSKEPFQKVWTHCAKLLPMDNDLTINYILEYDPAMPYEEGIGEHVYFYKHVNRFCQELNELASPLFDVD